MSTLHNTDRVRVIFNMGYKFIMDAEPIYMP